MRKIDKYLKKKSFVILIGIIFMIFFQVIYFVIQYYVEPVYNLQTSLDRSIPFIPWTIIIYLSIYPFILLVILLINAKDLIKVVMIYLLTCSIGWLFFIFFPAGITRPSLAIIDNEIWHFVYSLVHQIDAETNTFPSLHVATSWVAALILWQKRALFFTASFMAFLISVSTLTTKQHFFYDVMGGFCLAVFCWLLTEKNKLSRRYNEKIFSLN